MTGQARWGERATVMDHATPVGEAWADYYKPGMRPREARAFKAGFAAGERFTAQPMGRYTEAHPHESADCACLDAGTAATCPGDCHQENDEEARRTVGDAQPTDPHTSHGKGSHNA